MITKTQKIGKQVTANQSPSNASSQLPSKSNGMRRRWSSSASRVAGCALTLMLALFGLMGLVSVSGCLPTPEPIVIKDINNNFAAMSQNAAPKHERASFMLSGAVSNFVMMYSGMLIPRVVLPANGSRKLRQAIFL